VGSVVYLDPVLRSTAQIGAVPTVGDQAVEPHVAGGAEEIRADFALLELADEIEIWSRDEFVRNGSFEAIISRMEKGFSDLRSEITGRLDRMTNRRLAASRRPHCRDRQQVRLVDGSLWKRRYSHSSPGRDFCAALSHSGASIVESSAIVIT
jgi:hypothetical protein